MFRSVLQKLGAWTTVLKWNEPSLCRPRLKGDVLVRLAIAFGVGSLGSFLLLVLFGINREPPHWMYAGFGMLIFGVLACAHLFQGKATASGRVRICEEGIQRVRQGFEFAWFWTEQADWRYSQIQQCVIVPWHATGRSFSVLLIATPTDVDLIGIPERIDLRELAQLLVNKGVAVKTGTSIPESLTSGLAPVWGAAAGVLGPVMILGGLLFYAMNAPPAEREPIVRRGDFPDPRPQVPPIPESGGRDRAPALPGRSSLPDQPTSSGAEANSAASTPPAASPADTAVPSTIPRSVPGFGGPFGSRSTQAEPLPGAPAPGVPAARSDATANSAPAERSVPSRPMPRTPAPPPAPAGDRTDLIGGAGGFPFEIAEPEAGPVIGFRSSVGSWAGKTALSQFQPLYHSNSQPEDGDLRARDGYVVGGVQVHADELVRGVRVVFVRQQSDGSLDKSDFYLSDWIGEPSDAARRTLGNGLTPISGVYGRRGAVIDALGLVLAESQMKR